MTDREQGVPAHSNEPSLKVQAEKPRKMPNFDEEEFLFFNELSSKTAKIPAYLDELRLMTPTKNSPSRNASTPNSAVGYSPAFSPKPSTPGYAQSGQIAPSFMKPLDQDVDLAWFDEQRRLFTTYEYMCRIQEAREWIEETLHDPIQNCPSLNDFEELLRDGVLLCRLMRCFAPECIKRIFTAVPLQFRHSDNLVYFWDGCKKVGLPFIFTFELVDLYDKKNIPKVIYCLHALSHLIAKKGLGHGVKNLQGKVSFNESEIRQKDAELTLAGISMPAFNKVSQLIVDHLEKEEKELSIKVEPEVPDDDSVKLVQAYIKRLIAFANFDSVYLAAEIVQSQWKMILTNFLFYNCYDATEFIQAYLRGRKVKRQSSSLNSSAIVLQNCLKSLMIRSDFCFQNVFCQKIQSLFRRSLAMNAYLSECAALFVQSIIRSNYWKSSFDRIVTFSSSLLPADLIKFIDLFKNEKNLIQKEIELDQLRLSINKKLVEIQEKEEHLSDLDVKVGLLLRNTLSLQDFVRDTSKKNSQLEAKSGGSVDPDEQDANSLLRLDRNNHTKLKQYRQLFYLLQTDPQYLTEILTEMPLSKAKSFIDDCVLPLFGHGQSVNEEFLLIRLGGSLLKKETSAEMSTEDFMANDLLFVRLCLNYARGAKEISYLKSLLGPLIDEIIGNEAVSFETDPITIYREIIKQQEMESGQKSSLPYEISREDAFQTAFVKDKYIENLRSIQSFSRKFISSIIASVNDVPYSVRFLLKSLYAQTNDYRLVGHFIYYRYLNPAIISPETFDVLERPISSVDRRNLAEISRMLQFIVLGKTFSFQDYSHLIPLNDYISQANNAFSEYLVKLIDVPEPRDNFSIPNDVPLVESDYVYLSLNQIFKIHECVCTWSNSLKEIVATLGPAPRSFLNDQSIIRIDLMKPRNFTVYSIDGHSTLLLHVKKFLMLIFSCVSIVESIFNVSLLEFLSHEATPEEESLFVSACESPDLDDTLSESSVPSEYLSSLSSLKRCILADLSKLDGFRNISKETFYVEILIDFSRDLHDKRAQNRLLDREIEHAAKTVSNLEEKNSNLELRIQAINEYVRSAIQVLSCNTKPKKPLPFTKHYSHFKKLEKSGKMPQFGSYKYSAADLHAKGIIYSIAEYSLSQYDKISITISSNEPGVFVFEATLMGIKIPQNAIVRLEDLLDCQFNNVQKMSLFGGIAKVNVNLLIHFLNKKFFE